MKTVKVASVGSDAEIWRHIAEIDQAKTAGLKIEVEELNGGVPLNQAVSEGSVDANAFQSIEYLRGFNESNSSKLTPIGTTGSFNEDFALADVIVSTKFGYSDVDATGFDYAWGQVPQMPEFYPVDKALNEKVVRILQERITEFGIHNGFIAMSDSFMSSIETIQNIRKHLPDIVASDMESTPLAQIAYFYDIPVLNVRGISDHVGGEAPDTFEAVCTLVEEL